MTVDIEKLEALAKAAPAGPWYGPDELAHKGTVFDCDLGSLLSYESIESERDACVAYVAAANPAAVLELIASGKRMAARLMYCPACQGEGEIYSGRDSYQGYNQPPEPIMDKCGECDGDGSLGDATECISILDEIETLRAELAGLNTGYEAYERVNAELRAEKEALKEKYEAARDRKNSITALQAENAALRDAAAVSAMRIKELDLLFGRYILAMRAAIIEDEHGKTETAGMDWIFNSLAGPGQLPPEGETDAQAYFDREIVAVDSGMQEVLAFHDKRRAAKSKEQSHD